MTLSSTFFLDVILPQLSGQKAKLEGGVKALSRKPALALLKTRWIQPCSSDNPLYMGFYWRVIRFEVVSRGNSKKWAHSVNDFGCKVSFTQPSFYFTYNKMYSNKQQAALYCFMCLPQQCLDSRQATVRLPTRWDRKASICWGSLGLSAFAARCDEYLVLAICVRAGTHQSRRNRTNW